MTKDAKSGSTELIKMAAGAAEDKKASDIVILDIAKLLIITDYFMICSGATIRQTKTIAGAIFYDLKEAGHMPLRRAGEDLGDWILLDYGDFVIHIFTEETREYYQLERLWKDAPQLDVIS